jgi:hypothetical protein
MGWDAASTLLTLTYVLGVGVFLCCDTRGMSLGWMKKRTEW